MIWALLLPCLFCGAHGGPALGSATEKSSFTIPKSPSGMFFFSEQKLLYILCGTSTNGDHYLYAYGTDGSQKCLITIPAAVGMSRVDGFQIVGSTAYIADSQGPIYASEAGKLGKSVYAVEWTNPCGCDTNGACTKTAASWSPSVSKSYTLTATQADIGDGGGNDAYFRNSGVAVTASHFFAVNGVHPISGSLSGAYPKSLVKVGISGGAVAQKWSFTGTTIGHQVDMEALTCGADGCASAIYIGDEYNFVYKLNLATADPAKAVEVEWNLQSIVGAVGADKGIESMTYADGLFYVGIQDTAKVHVVQLSETAMAASATCSAKVTTSYMCTAAKAASQRVRKELRSLTSAEWQKVVDAIWTMKNTSQADGVAKFGSSFRPYDYFVVKHGVNTKDSRGDQAHFSSAFATWHGAFVLEFENALLAVDASIGALPYWDGTHDVTTPAYFGSAPGTGAESTVVDGKFADFPVTQDFKMADWASYIKTVEGASNAFTGAEGVLRQSGNTLKTKVVTRYGSGWTFGAACQEECHKTAGCFFDWFLCIEGGSSGGNFHSGAHSSIGGSSGTMQSDFKDTITSPNDPIFMFHHANVDRNRMAWMRAHRNEAAKFWGYEEKCDAKISGCPSTGVGIDDVAGALFPFSSADLGLAGSSAGVTHGEFLCMVGPETAPYTYGPSQADAGTAACSDAAGGSGGPGGATGGPTGGGAPVACTTAGQQRCCGDNVCGGPETAETCPADCSGAAPTGPGGAAPPSSAPPGTTTAAPEGNVTASGVGRRSALLALACLLLA